MEIYKEKIRDLLADNDSDHSPQIQEDKKVTRNTKHEAYALHLHSCVFVCLAWRLRKEPA